MRMLRVLRIFAVGSATATGILGDEVPASLPVTVIHVPVVEGSGSSSSFEEGLLAEAEKLQRTMKSHFGSMGRHFGATADGHISSGIASFLARASAGVAGEPTMSDIEAIAGLAQQSAAAYKEAAGDLPTQAQLAKKIAEANQSDLGALYAADADEAAGESSRGPAGVRGA